MKLYLSILVISTLNSAIGQQLPNMNTPQTPKPSGLADLHGASNNVHQQNRKAMMMTGIKPPPTQSQIKTNFYRNPMQVKKEVSEINKIINELEGMTPREKKINFSLPSYQTIYPQKTKHYQEAYAVLDGMMSGQKKTDLGKAVFSVESAYYENIIDYKTFDNQLNQLSKFCLDYMNANGYDTNSNLALNMMLYRLFADTLELNGRRHLPIRYDFKDYRGSSDWSKMFVTKLVKTNSGQCHSMPLLYLVLAERIGAEAFLSFAPEHSYIKFRDRKNNWYNIELTNGRLTSESFILGSGYIKTEAIRSDIYMDTIGRKKVLAHLMFDLAKGYRHKFGFDPFIVNTLNRSLEVFPNNIFALLEKSDYYTVLFMQYMKQIPDPKPSLRELQTKYPKVYDIYVQRNKMYDLIDNIGYEPMSPEAYEAWLKSVDQKVNQAQHEEQQKK